MIRIGAMDSRNILTIELEQSRRAHFYGSFFHHNADGVSTAEPRIIRPAIAVRWDETPLFHYFLDQWGQSPILGEAAQLLESRTNKIREFFVSTGGLFIWEIASLWNAISLTPLEDTVVSGLRLIAPEVERVTVTSNTESRSGPVVRAKLKGSDEPVPLRSLGDGMNRLFGITLALVNARNGMLLIDEVENGIHYTVQPDLWRLLFEVAGRLNVQVFASTHSYDCICAFQQAANENPEEGVLVRLDRREENVAATLFTEDELEVVAAEGMEVR